jgi:methylglutaconyl-CoA hydratase
MIQVKVTDNVGTIVLDRPNQCNALNRQMVEQLIEALSDLHQEKRVRGIILTGAGSHFCAGIDLKQWQQTSGSDDSMHQWFNDSQALKTLLENMLQLPKPIVAAVDGAAIGSGLALVLAADLVICSHRATFSVPSTRLGLVSGFVAPLATFRCGAALASQLLIGCSELAASDAKSLGFVHHVVDSELIWIRAKTWLESISQGAHESIQLTKRLLNEMVGETMLSQLASGAAAMATSLTTEAAGEGLQAFTDKREPKFPR